MNFSTLGDFARYLHSVGELHRATVEVDPYPEITEIIMRSGAKPVGSHCNGPPTFRLCRTLPERTVLHLSWVTNSGTGSGMTWIRGFHG
jgi:hypothetical protein